MVVKTSHFRDTFQNFCYTIASLTTSFELLLHRPFNAAAYPSHEQTHIPHLISPTTAAAAALMTAVVGARVHVVVTTTAFGRWHRPWRLVGLIFVSGLILGVSSTPLDSGLVIGFTFFWRPCPWFRIGLGFSSCPCLRLCVSPLDPRFHPCPRRHVEPFPWKPGPCCCIPCHWHHVRPLDRKPI